MTPIRSSRVLIASKVGFWLFLVSLLSLECWQNCGSALQAQDDDEDGGFFFFFDNGDEEEEMEAMEDGDYEDEGEDEELTPLQERLLERQEERLDRLYERGVIDDEQYEERMDNFMESIGVSQDTSDYEPGWQERYSDWQQYQQNDQLNVDQKRLYMDYVIHGDGPLEAEKGLVPKPNPVLEAPQSYTGVEASRLSKAITENLTAELDALKTSLPEGYRIDDALTLVETLKSEGAQQALLDNLQAAVVDRDIRRFERNAQALKVTNERIQKLLIGLTMENLRDGLEDHASIADLARITELMVKRLDDTQIDGDLRETLPAWLSNLPQLVQAGRDLTSNVPTPATQWPEGELNLIFDPSLPVGESRLLSGGYVAVGGEGEPRISVGTGDRFQANGLCVLNGEASSVESGDKPETPSALIRCPQEIAASLNFTMTCYTESRGSSPKTKAWSKEYSLKPGDDLTFPFNWDGRASYLIECHPVNGQGQSAAFTIKRPAGYSPTYDFVVNGNSVSISRDIRAVTLDNSQNSRPFHYMLGDEYNTLRAGATVTLESGVTLRYARNGNTGPVKDSKGQVVPNVTEATDISTVTLRDGDTGVIGINASGNWEIRKGGEVQVVQRNHIKVPVAVTQTNLEGVASTEPVPTVAPRGTLHVLAFGVSKYKRSEDFPALMFADKDATDLSGLLSKQKQILFEDVRVTTLTNEQATAIKIRNELIGLDRNVTKNDTVALIFSGHGLVDKTSQGYYFCPHDADPEKISRMGISSKELQLLTSELSARNVFVFLDSCYSGSATDEIQKSFDSQIARVESSGVVIFASSKGSESSQELEAWGHGALTKSFLDTVSDISMDANKDSLVQVSELDRGLTDGIKRLTGGGQHARSAELGSTVRNLPLVRFGSP
jgi:hypothetical protein